VKAWKKITDVMNANSVTFLVNEARFETIVLAALLVSAAAHEQLIHDYVADTCVIQGGTVNSSGFSNLLDLFRVVRLDYPLKMSDHYENFVDV
jgi:hypothetical protein